MTPQLSTAPWRRSAPNDPQLVGFLDTHYSRQTPGSAFVGPPGYKIVLKAYAHGRIAAAWITLRSLHTKHDWPGAWECSAFRNEGAGLSSLLILDALAYTRGEWGDPPPEGVITMVDPAEVQSPNPGYCFLMAGFRRVGFTRERGRLVLHLPPEGVPAAAWTQEALCA